MTSEAAEGFDGWYSDMAHSPRRAAIQQGALGLPIDLESSGLLPWDGIDSVVAAVCVGAGELLVDLGCGRGGYGLEIARRTGARLTRVDFSSIAIKRAREVAAEREVPATFNVGELAATGLATASVDAVVCIDAMQFADSYANGLREVHRILRAGGRFALTGWQWTGDSTYEVPERLRREIATELTEAGFANVRTQHMPRWREAERALRQAAVAAPDDGDPGLASLRAEGERVLTWLDGTQRLLVTARRH